MLTYITLNKDYLGMANKFAEEFIDDEYFTHFQHTKPAQMLEDWFVLMGIENGIIKSWGQIQLPTNTRKKHVCRLGFAVTESSRGQGLGSEMVEEIIQVAKKMKFRKLVATTRNDNYPMLCLFLKNGFTVEGQFYNEEFINNRYVHYLSLAKWN